MPRLGSAATERETVMSLAIIEPRTFATHVVLCVVTNTIPDSGLMPEVYQLLEFLTGGPVPTAQLSAAMHEANRFLAYRKPELLKGWSASERTHDFTREWVAQKVQELGESLAVVRN